MSSETPKGRSPLRYDHETLVHIGENSRFDLTEKELRHLQEMDIAPDRPSGTRSLLATPPLSPSMHPMVSPTALSLGGKAEGAFRVSMPEDERGRMIKQIKGALNKITPEKYDILASQIVAYFEPSTSDAIVPLIFEKALNELTFAEMYADLFRDLLHKVATCTQSHTTFLMALMLRCNLELTKALSADEKEVDGDKSDGERKVLKRSVGISQFIGELFIRDMLKEDFLFKVITKLLHLNESKCDNVKQMEAEVACKLIETAGHHWETSSARFKSDILPRLDDLTDNHPKPRIRFMFLDLQDLRKRGWQHRFNKQKPKKLTEDGVLKQSSSGRSESPLSLRDGLASLGLYETRSTHDPYGECHTFTSESFKPRSATPPPTRGVPLHDSFQQRKRNMTPPPQRVIPFMPTVEIPTVTSSQMGSAPVTPLPSTTAPVHSSSQPPSPAPIYQHNPYSYTSPQPSPLPSPQPAVPQMQWAEVSQPSGWQQQTGTEEVPHWQQASPQAQWQQDQSLNWQNQEQMGWQTPDSSLQWAGQGWAADPANNQPLSPPLSPPGAMISMTGKMSLPISNQGLPLQMPLQVLRQPIPIVDPKQLDQTGADMIQLGPPKMKYQGPILPGGEGRGRRDSPVGRQIPIDGSTLDMRARPMSTPEYAYPIDPNTLESMPRPSQRRGTPPSRALPIEPPVNPPVTPPPR